MIWSIRSPLYRGAWSDHLIRHVAIKAVPPRQRKFRRLQPVGSKMRPRRKRVM